MQGIEMLVFVLPRDRGNALLKRCAQEDVTFSVIMHGHGTASSEILSMLGAGDTQRDIVLMTVSVARAKGLLISLSRDMELEKPWTGIAFTVPLSAAASQLDSYKLLEGGPGKSAEGTANGGKEKMETGKHDLIVTIVNRGFADDVMAAAREAGAFGGTVINSRGSGMHELDSFFGTVLEPEKETVLILIEREKRNAVMESICKNAGLSKAGMGICFSLPVDGVMGISRFAPAESTSQS